MPDIQTEGKGKSKKKKSKANGPAKNSALEVTKSAAVEPSAIKLPESVNESTYINEVQVTLTEKPVPPVSAKKNKKKKSAKEQDKQVPTNDSVSTESLNADQPPLLHFSRSECIELKNRPEITVTRTNAEEPKPKDVQSEPVVEESVGTATTKKKKKKKKKKSVSEKENAADTESKAAADSVSSAPTYVKLPATGDACVLVVSHENFGNNASAYKKDESPALGSSQTMNLADLKNPAIVPSKVLLAEVQNQPRVSIDPLPNEVAGSPKDLNVKLGYNVTKGNTADNNEKPTSTANSEGTSKSKQKAGKQVRPEGQKPLEKKAVDSTKESAKSLVDPKGKAAKAKPVSKDKMPSHVRMFAHLPQFKPWSSVSKHLESKTEIHPAIIAVGAQCADGIINGSNARCVAILSALQEVIKDYQTPPNKELSRDLESKFQQCANFISKCRPLSVSMANAVRIIKNHVTNMPSNISDKEAKFALNFQITKFIKEEICLAKKAISSYAEDKIVDGDVILTYAYSSVVKEALFEAHEQNKRFRVIVVDSRPKMEGREMLKCLLKQKIDCSYTLINGISYVMKEVTKVIIGAHALQANGYVMSRIGSSQIAVVASYYNVPFLVCCETYKFCERVHTDSFVYNELGDPGSFLKVNNVSCGTLDNWKDVEKLQLLSLLYDLTAPHLVSMVITEKGMLPCTSVPVVLRVRHAGSHD